MDATTHETLAEIRDACQDCRTLDDLLTVLEGVADLLGERPESEASLRWMPTFTDEALGDGGEGWEVLSWDATRLVTLHKNYGSGGWSIRVQDRAED